MHHDSSSTFIVRLYGAKAIGLLSEDLGGDEQGGLRRRLPPWLTRLKVLGSE